MEAPTSVGRKLSVVTAVNNGSQPSEMRNAGLMQSSISRFTDGDDSGIIVTPSSHWSAHAHRSPG
jgi:hypothetical protein